MMNLVLVDDEPAQRAGMRTLIDWEAQGCHIVGEAGDGQSGLRLLETLLPDVALVDMKMPVVSGVELIRRARELSLPTRFIVLSGYGDFEYTKQAILLGVDAYLLKPIDEDELIQSLSMMKSRIDEEKQYAKYLLNGRRNSLCTLVRSQVENPAGAPLSQEDIKRLHEALGAPPYVVTLLCFHPKADGQHLPDDAKLAEFFSEPRIFAYAADSVTLVLSGVEKSSLPAWIKHLHSRLHMQTGINAFFAVGAIARTQRELYHTWQSAKAIALNAFFYQDRPFLMADSLTPQVPEEKPQSDAAAAIEQISDAVHIFDAERIDQGLSALSEIFLQGAYSVGATKSVCSGMVTELLAEAHAQQASATLPDRDQVVLTIYSTENLLQLIQYLREQLKPIAATMSDATADTVVKRMVSYVDKHYAQRLTLDRLGEIFGYNGAYLGRIFHRFTGMHFPDYLDKKRIDEAKLLLAGGMRIYQAAQKVGFSNQDYFSVRFKKREGISPKEYIDKCIDS